MLGCLLSPVKGAFKMIISCGICILILIAVLYNIFEPGLPELNYTGWNLTLTFV